MSVCCIEDLNPDFPAVKKRWEAWWHDEVYDRPVVHVLAPLDQPRSDIPPQPDLNVDPTTRWTNADFLVRRMVEFIRTTYFGGDAVPIAANPISAGHALYFGARPQFGPWTVSVDPAPCTPDAYPCFAGWEQSPWWELAQQHVAALAGQSHGRWLAAPFWGNGPADTQAAVRGFEQFYFDIPDERDTVRGAAREMADILWGVYRRLGDLACPAPNADGYASILGQWSSQPIGIFDADIAYNLSPRDFQEILLPPMAEAMAGYPRTAYHLDGPGALVHLDALLAVKSLHAIQWVQGASGGGALNWLDVIHKIQSAGKAIQVYCAPDEIERLAAEVRPQGLCIFTSAGSESEARQTVARIAKAFIGK